MYFQLIHIDFINYSPNSHQTIVSKGLHTKICSIIWIRIMRQILLSEVMYSKTHWLEGLLFYVPLLIHIEFLDSFLVLRSYSFTHHKHRTLIIHNV